MMKATRQCPATTIRRCANLIGKRPTECGTSVVAEIKTIFYIACVSRVRCKVYMHVLPDRHSESWPRKKMTFVEWSSAEVSRRRMLPPVTQRPVSAHGIIAPSGGQSSPEFVHNILLDSPLRAAD